MKEVRISILLLNDKRKKERAGLASKLSLPIAHWDTIYFILNEANTRWRRGNMRYHGAKKYLKMKRASAFTRSTF